VDGKREKKKREKENEGETKRGLRQRMWGTLHGFWGPRVKKGRSQTDPTLPLRFHSKTLVTLARSVLPFDRFLRDTCVPDRLVRLFIYPAGRIDATCIMKFMNAPTPSRRVPPGG